MGSLRRDHSLEMIKDITEYYSNLIQPGKLGKIGGILWAMKLNNNWKVDYLSS